MKLPTIAQAREHPHCWRSEDLAWWIEQCEGTPEEMRVVACTILLDWLSGRTWGLDWQLKEVARSLVHASALRKSPCCQGCGSDAFCIAHHINYRRPLDIYWLCRRCHSGIHSRGLSWLSSEEDLRPEGAREPDTFSTRQFPLLDALWSLRGELELPLDRQIVWLADALTADLGCGNDPGPKPEEPVITLLREAAKHGQSARSLLQLAKNAGATR